MFYISLGILKCALVASVFMGTSAVRAADRTSCSLIPMWFSKSGQLGSDGEFRSVEIKLEPAAVKDPGQKVRKGSGVLKGPFGYEVLFDLRLTEFVEPKRDPLFVATAQFRKVSDKATKIVFTDEDSEWVTQQTDPDLGPLPLMSMLIISWHNVEIMNKFLALNPDAAKLGVSDFNDRWLGQAFKGAEFAQNDVARIDLQCLYSKK